MFHLILYLHSFTIITQNHLKSTYFHKRIKRLTNKSVSLFLVWQNQNSLVDMFTLEYHGQVLQMIVDLWEFSQL